MSYIIHPRHQAWINWLSPYQFQWFCTFTFPEPVHQEKADKSFRYWLSHLNAHIYGTNYHRRKRPATIWVRALELQRKRKRTYALKRDVIHYHALIGRVGYADRHQFAKLWQCQTGGFAKIDPVGDNYVYNYTTKYVSKDDEGDIDVSPWLHHLGQLPSK